MIFLVEYDRQTETLVSFTPFEKERSEEAANARISLEKELLSKGISHEIVLLEARDEESLRVTHRRYFEQLSDFSTPKAVAN